MGGNQNGSESETGRQDSNSKREQSRIQKVACERRIFTKDIEKADGSETRSGKIYLHLVFVTFQNETNVLILYFFNIFCASLINE